jgi:hypothetical protein
MDAERTRPNNSAILFGGVPAIPSPEVFENARKNNPTWYQLLEKAYGEFANRPENVGVYADPKGKGATLEQAWLVFTLFGVEPYCLLAHKVPQNQTSKISRLVPSTAGEVIDTLKKIQSGEGGIHQSTLHFDGKTGHNIVVTSYDEKRDRFIYHDPWPLKSLLCRENNMADVDAQPEGTRWSVTSEELERVIFASMVFPHIWARLQGVDFDLMLDQWKQSEFFKFFHLKEISQRSENGMTRVMFSVGPFKESISLMIDYKENGKIAKAVLLINKEWAVKNAMMALDLEKSFISSFAPAPDKEAYDEIGLALWSLRGQKFAEDAKEKIKNQSQAVQFLDAFMGSARNASMNTDFGSLSLNNIDHGQEHLHELEFALL